MDKDLVSLKEASRICGVGHATMNDWIRASGARLVRAGGEKWIKRSYLASWLRSRDLPMPVELAGRPRMLIVEDEGDLRTLIEHHMRRWWNGAEIRSAGDSESALKLLVDYHPDLAVVDVNLPGKDGLSFCREVFLEPELTHTKILVMTASHELEAEAGTFADGAIEFLYKPFGLEGLHSAARHLLGVSH